jgi:hypothetical protein
MFVTRNTEYHLRLDQCVGVRDLQTGDWHRHHAALRLRAIALPSMGHDHHWVGRRLQFWSTDKDVVTSQVIDVGRPEPEVIPHYVSQERSGLITNAAAAA